MTGKRRPLVLLAVLGAFGAYYLWTLAAEAPGRARVAQGSAGRSTAPRLGAVGEVEELALSRLERKPGVYRQGRDLFRFGTAPRPTQPQPVPPAPSSPPVELPVPTSVVKEPPEPQPPPIDVVYLGNFGRPGRRIAVFSDDQNIYNALVGDIIKEKFVLVSIGYESVDFSFVGFPETVTQRLAVGGLR